MSENVHWETQGHLELATGGTTTVNIALSAEKFLHALKFKASCDPSLSVVHSSCLRSVCGVKFGRSL